MLPPEEELFSLPLEATISAVDTTGDRPAYSWVAQRRHPITGEMEDADPPRWGEADRNPLYEINDRDDVAVDTVVLATFNGYVGGEPTYRFDGGPAAAASSGATIAAKEKDGTPSLTGITTIRTDQATGLGVVAGGAGEADIYLYAASATQWGAVTDTAQSWAGLKTFDDGLKSRDVVYMRDAGSGIEFRADDSATDSVTFGTASVTGAPLAQVIASDDALGYNAILTVDYNSTTASRGALVLSNTTPAGNDFPAIKLNAAGFGTLAGGDVASGLGQRFQSGLFISGRPAARTPPATSTSTGTFGDLACDSSWLYVCTGTNAWRRVALTTF